MATKADQESINSLGLQKRKISVKGNRNYILAPGKISAHWRSKCFIKAGTEGDKTRAVGNLVFHDTHRKSTAPASKAAWPFAII